MQNKSYFKEYKDIEEIIDAKSLSFKYHGKNIQFDHFLLKEFLNILEHENTFRLLLHNSTQSDLHNMVIAMDESRYVFPHKHEKSESYQIIEGEMLLIYFEENGDINKFVKLSKNDSLISRVDNHYFHGIIPLSKYIIYHETRIGPFEKDKDSFFATWSGKNDVAYMKKILNIYQELL